MDTPIETPSSHTGEEQIPGLAIANTASVEKIVQLLKAKDDTSRFVGLALLKSTLDTSEELRGDEAAVTALWASISPRFLDRLLRTGSKPGTKQTDAKEMLDLAAHVIYTFTILLPDAQKSDSNLLGRVPLLVNAILQRWSKSLVCMGASQDANRPAVPRRQQILSSERSSQSLAPHQKAALLSQRLRTGLL